MKKIMVIILVMFCMSQASYAKRSGQEGGGGDASEARVNEIRTDILKWITNGGAKFLSFPPRVSYDMYLKKMSAILKPKKVVVSFTDKTVLVKGEEKTCRGFVAGKSVPKMICNIKRFAATPDADQYTLIHHEYAGLAGMENNEAGASDYEISNQLTGFLVETTVLKLSILGPVDQEENRGQEHQVLKNVIICSTQCQDESMEHRGHDAAKVGTIYYAQASCDGRAKAVEVISNRMSDESSKSCMNALAGRYYGKVVNIDTNKPFENDDEGTFFSIEVVK